MIDTAEKRRSAIATRRLPWFRRFAIPAPDSTISQADRQTVAFCYGGVLAGAAVADTPSLCIDLPWRPMILDLPLRPMTIDLPPRR